MIYNNEDVPRLKTLKRVGVLNCEHSLVICVTIAAFVCSLHKETVKHVRYTHHCLFFVTVPVLSNRQESVTVHCVFDELREEVDETG